MVEKVKDRLDIKKDDTIIHGDYSTSQIIVSPTLFKILIDQYKDPIGSIVREITSNAIDATNEANVDEPVIVTLTYSKFTVEDFGIGISPERVHNYFDFNKSTKRNSTNQIGMFGLGAKCVLSYRNDLTIRTRYNGKEYNYLQFIDDTGMPSYKLISTTDTSKPNGTKVEIDIKKNDDAIEFSKKIKNLIFTKIVYIDNNVPYGDDDNGDINHVKLYQYKTFMVKTVKTRKYQRYDSESPFIIYNGIVYPLDLQQLYDNVYEGDPYIIRYLPLGIIVNGDKLSLVPSRDNFKYDNSTKQTLIDTISSVVSELKDIQKSQFENNDVHGFLELINAINIDTSSITLGGQLYTYTGLEQNTKLTVKTAKLKSINLIKLRDIYTEPVFIDIKNVYFTSDYKGKQETNKLRYISKNDIFIKTDDAKYKIAINEQISKIKTNSTKIKYVKFRKRSAESRKLLNVYLKRYYNNKECGKILKYIEKIETEFYNNIKTSYNDYYKLIVSTNTPVSTKERIIGNIYLLDGEDIKRQHNLKTYNFKPDDNYIFGTNDDYNKLKKLKRDLNNEITNSYKVKFAVFSKLFLKKLLKNNVKINYIYIEDLPNFMKKEENIKNKIYEYISNIYTLDYVRLELDRRLNNFNTYCCKDDYIDIFTEDIEIRKILHESLINGYKYYSSINILKSLNVDVEEIINQELVNILLDFTNFFSNYNNLDLKESLRIYSDTLKDDDKFKNMLSSKPKKSKHD